MNDDQFHSMELVLSSLAGGVWFLATLALCRRRFSSREPTALMPGDLHSLVLSGEGIPRRVDTNRCRCLEDGFSDLVNPSWRLLNDESDCSPPHPFDVLAIYAL